jgi:hypothetical protein
MDIFAHTKIPTITESELGLDEVSVDTVEKEGQEGNIKNNELEIISKLIKKAEPLTVFEFGTFDGRTTINFARHTPPHAEVYTLDLPKEKMEETKFPLVSTPTLSETQYVWKEKSGTRYVGKEGGEKIVQLYGDSAVFDFSPYCGEISFIFVDASHAPDYVRNDTDIAVMLAKKPGALILWHDYGKWPGVTAVLEWYYVNNPHFRGIRRIIGTSFALLRL